jgi:hypothetical protein
VAKLGGWVAKLGVWVARLGGWVAKLGEWVAKLVQRPLAMEALRVRIQTSLKNHKWAT